jgi:acyl-CoA thioester hydrolase
MKISVSPGGDRSLRQSPGALLENGRSGFSPVSPRWSGMHEKQIEIRWRDIDALGHVNNAVYLTYFEEVRDELFQLTLDDEEAIRHFVVARITIAFRRGVTQADDFVIARAGVVRIGMSSVTTQETIVDQQGTICAEAESVVVAWDPAANHSRPLNETERAAFGQK